MLNRRKPASNGRSSEGYGAIKTEEAPPQAAPETPAVEEDVKHYNHISGIAVKDHFSLVNPTSTVRFADDETLVFVDNNEQLTLEKKNDEDFITAKQSTISSPGLMLLRFAYTLVTAFMTGWLVVFCIQVVLFLFLGLAIESGKLRFTRIHMHDVAFSLFRPHTSSFYVTKA